MRRKTYGSKVTDTDEGICDVLNVLEELEDLQPWPQLDWNESEYLEHTDSKTQDIRKGQYKGTWPTQGL